MMTGISVLTDVDNREYLTSSVLGYLIRTGARVPLTLTYLVPAYLALDSEFYAVEYYFLAPAGLNGAVVIFLSSL